jgi:hypothetical protein
MACGRSRPPCFNPIERRYSMVSVYVPSRTGLHCGIIGASGSGDPQLPLVWWDSLKADRMFKDTDRRAGFHASHRGLTLLVRSCGRNVVVRSALLTLSRRASSLLSLGEVPLATYRKMAPGSRSNHPIPFPNRHQDAGGPKCSASNSQEPFSFFKTAVPRPRPLAGLPSI